MAKPAPAHLRVTLADGSLDATIPGGTLLWTLIVAAVLKRDAIDAHTVGSVSILRPSRGGYEVRLRTEVDETLARIPAT